MRVEGRLAGKVVAVTGAARGQGRSHAVLFARHGADVIAIDSCHEVESAGYPMPTKEQLAETAELVEAEDRRIVTAVADVRDRVGLRAAVDEGVATLGRLDAVVANAGICTYGRLAEMEEQVWHEMLDINLTGVWHTVQAAIPHLRAAGGGSLVLTSSVLGLRGGRNIGHYSAAKHGVVGLMRSLAVELAPERIRANCVCPGTVGTDMFLSAPTFEAYAPDLAPEERTLEAMRPRFTATNPMGLEYLESQDISYAALYLASDESRYVTGITVPVDAGRLQN